MEKTASCEMLVYLTEMTDNRASTVHMTRPRFTHAQIIFSVVISCINDYNCQFVFKSLDVLVYFIPFSNYSKITDYKTRLRATSCFMTKYGWIVCPTKDKKAVLYCLTGQVALVLLSHCIKVDEKPERECFIVPTLIAWTPSRTHESL